MQLIKQLSATPTIPAQRTAEEIAQDGTLDPQASLRANKEVFFFRLVSPGASLFRGYFGADVGRNRSGR